MLEKGTIIADRYEILDKIGTGGMADVYKAKCHKLNRFVAIKVLKQELSEDRNFVARFRAEAQSAAGMTHPNIVNVYDVGDENGIYYIVMELVEGITLKQYIDKKGALEYREAISIAIQVAQGIEAAHKHHIVHKDIKPQNIIISKEGKVKVTDFGIAKATTSNTIDSSAMGSVHYISPEQARGGFSDTKSDIYSFGIMLYEMCTGQVPFDGETTVSVALKHVQEEMVPPSKINPSVPVSLERIIMRCTQKKTEMRYDDATQLIADLKKALVTPYEDFVVMPDRNVDGATRMIPSEEVKKEVRETGMKKKQDSGKKTSSSREVEPEQEDNGLDKLVMWLGIGIAVIAVIATIIVMMKLFNVLNGNSGISGINKPTQAATQAETDDGKIEMPNLVGYTEDAARQLLKDCGLGFKRAKDYSDLFEEGYVMEQSIDAGTRVLPNTTIVVTISEGVKTFELTDVTGMDEDAARQILEEEQGLVVSPEYVYDEEIEQGLVVSTMPIAGEDVSVGDTITIKVSRGPEKADVIVPDIRNMTESEARQALDAKGLVPVAAGYENSSSVAEGNVISQSYAAGKTVPAGTSVEYVLSLGNSGSEPTYRGQISVDNAWFAASKPSDFDDEYGVTEFRVVVRQSSGGNDYTSVAQDYMNVNVVGFPYTVTFEGPAKGVSTANVDVYVRYTWQDINTRQTRQEVYNVRSMTVTLGAN